MRGIRPARDQITWSFIDRRVDEMRNPVQIRQGAAAGFAVEQIQAAILDTGDLSRGNAAGQADDLPSRGGETLDCRVAAEPRCNGDQNDSLGHAPSPNSDARITDGKSSSANGTRRVNRSGKMRRSWVLSWQSSGARIA